MLPPGLRELEADLRRKGRRSSRRCAARPAAGRLPALKPEHPETDADLPDPKLLRHADALARRARHRCRPAAPSAEGHTYTMSTPTRHAVAADSVFDGDRRAARLRGRHRRRADRWHRAARASLPAELPVQELPEGAWLAPGFIDVQVNGGGDVLFNDDADARRHCRDRRRASPFRHDVAAADADQRHAGEDARGDRRGAEPQWPASPGVLGIHLEGPFLSPEKPGVHDPAMIRAPDARRSGAADVAGGERTPVVTLAPECVPPRLHRRAGALRACVSRSATRWPPTSETQAAHRRRAHRLHPSLQRDAAACEPRARARSPRRSKRRGAGIGSSSTASTSYPAMLRLALRGAARPMLVTDAMPPVGGRRAELHALRRGDHRARRTLRDRTARSRAAALDMASGGAQLRAPSRRAADRALRFASTEPARVPRARPPLGRLAPAFRADVVAFLPDSMEVLNTWVAGQPATSK